jgi:predicted DNA-binding transcriptional regulator AlpA
MTQVSSLLRIEDVMRRVGFRRNKLYALINAGDFVRPIKIGRMSAWVEAEVDQWIADRIAERDRLNPRLVKSARGIDPAGVAAD